MSSREHLLDLIRNNRIDRLMKDALEYFRFRLSDNQRQLILLQNEYTGLYVEQDINRTERPDELARKKRVFVLTMTEFVRQNAGNEPWVDRLNEEDINLSLADLKRHLLELLRQNGLSALIAFTHHLFCGADLKKRLKKIEKSIAEVDFQQSERMRQVTDGSAEGSGLEEAVRLLELTKNRKDKYLSIAARLIDEIDEETDLVDRWRITFRNTEANFSWHDSAGERGLLLSPLESIQVPVYLREDGNYLPYKRLMVRAQDAYLSHQYEEAYDLFIQVRNEIDPESSQLYELLLITYFQKQGGARLIDDYLSKNTRRVTPDKKENPLYQLYLYASRFHLLQGNRKPDGIRLLGSSVKEANRPGSDLIAQPARPVFSHTGRQNIKTIASQLLLRLAERHTRITDRIFSGAISREKATTELWRCITTTRNIYQYLQPDYIVFSTIIGELLGTGANFWITVDELGNPANVHPELDAIGYFHAIVGLVANEKYRNQPTKGSPLSPAEHKTLEQVSAEVNADLAAMISDGLRIKYEGLPQAPSLTPDEAAATYQPYVELMQSYRVADILLPDSGLFFEIPFIEIGNGEGKVDWFQLGRGRRLYTRFSAPAFDTLAYFEDLCRRKDLYAGTRTVEFSVEHLIQMYYVRLSDQTFDLYRTIDLTGEFDLAQAGSQRVGETLFCYRNWQICFDVNEDESFLKLCHDEVVGNGILFWWAIGKHGLHANPRNLPRGLVFDAREELNWLNDQCGVSKREDDQLTVTLNYLNRIAIPRSNAIGRHVHNQLNPAIEDQNAVLNFVEKALQLTNVVGAISPLEDFVYDELIRERIFRWYDLEGDRFINEQRIYGHGVDAIPALNTAQEVFVGSNRFTTEHLQDMITLNRENDISKSYTEDFSRNQERNYEEETIILFVKMIERLISYHKVTGNAKLLSMPYEELITGKGKVRWARHPWTVFAIDKVVSVEKDTYGHPAHIGIKKWQIVRGRIRPRPRVRKVAHFDFRDAYFYVKYNYEADAMKV